MDSSKDSATRTEGEAEGAGGMDRKEAERVFNRFDENGDGKISAAELGKVVRALGPEVSEREVEVMIQEMDSNRDGFVDMKEFAEFHQSGREKVDGDLKEAFDMYDLNRNGLISSKELHLVLEKLGDKCSVEDCARMIRSVDSDGDGYVNFEEFKTMMGVGASKKKAEDEALLH